MYCVPKVFLILCTITLIKAVGLKIDGLLNLGDNWSYEYRILKTDSNDPPRRAKEISQNKNDNVVVLRQKDVDKEKEIVRHRDKKTAEDSEKELARQRDEEIAHYKNKIARLRNEKAARIQGQMEHLQLAEQVLRNQADRLRKEAQNPNQNQRQGPDNDYQIHYIHNTNVPKTVKTTEAEKTEVSDRSNSDESDHSGNPKKGTMMIYDDTTKKPKKMLRDASRARDYSDTHSYSSESREGESRDYSERSTSFKDKTRQGIEKEFSDASTSSHDSAVNIISIDNYTTPKDSKKLINESLKAIAKDVMLLGKNKTEGPPKTTKVTTVRTGDIFTDAHQVKDDTKILEFTNHIYKQVLKIFGTIKEKTNQDNVKAQIESLARSYQEKFNEFIKDTSGQKIKTRLGTQKVILNTIDTSNRLLRRLMNFMVSDLDKKGVLRHNAGTANRFQKAIETEEKLQSIQACKKFGICRSGPGFSAFLADVMGILLKCDDKKFKQSMDAFTEVVKNIDFSDLLKAKTEKKLKAVIDRIERENVVMLRAMVMILKNTLISQNKPLIVNNYAARSNIVNSTLALLEVIDLLDTQIPRNESNALEWADMKNSLEGFANDKRSDVQDIMGAIMKHVIKNLRALDKTSQQIVSRNLDMILSLVVN